MAQSTAGFDSNVWYQITNNAYNTPHALRVGDGKEGVYMYPTNTSSPQQQWQVIHAVSEGWNIRSAFAGPSAYLSEYGTGGPRPPPDPTASYVCMEIGKPGDLQWEWILLPGGDGNFNILLNSSNPAFSGFYIFVNGTDDNVGFSNNASLPTGLNFTFNSIAQINDVTFSSAVPSASSTTTSQSTTSPRTSSVTTPTQTSLLPATSASAAPSKGGLSTGAAAAIGVPIALAALIIAGGAAFWFSRRQKNTRAATDGKSTPLPEPPETSELPPKDNPPQELPGPVPELSSGTDVHGNQQSMKEIFEE